MFAVLVKTQTNSSLFSESQFFSANLIILESTIFDIKNVIIIAKSANSTFINISILKNSRSIFVLSLAWFNSFSHFLSAKVRSIVDNNTIIRNIIFFIKKDIC